MPLNESMRNIYHYIRCKNKRQQLVEETRLADLSRCIPGGFLWKAGGSAIGYFSTHFSQLALMQTLTKMQKIDLYFT
jgi:hypothetical protein